jgi:hypothetical protein
MSKDVFAEGDCLFVGLPFLGLTCDPLFRFLLCRVRALFSSTRSWTSWILAVLEICVLARTLAL